MMNMDRLAAIDIGSNSIRCIVVEAERTGKYRVLDDEKIPVRLSAGLFATGSLAKSAWRQAIEALTQMKKIALSYGVSHIEAVATSAVRQAQNGNAFVAAVADEVGLEVTVVSGEEEGRLALASALYHFDLSESRFAMIDLGGGSAEVVTAKGEAIQKVRSLELGGVVLTERFLSGGPVRRSEHRLLASHIRSSLDSAFPEKESFPRLIGSGGTLTALAAMAMAQQNEGYTSTHGYELSRAQIARLREMLAGADLKKRQSIPGLNPDRADIIVAGVTVVDELMRHFGASHLMVNERGLREGLILKALVKRRFLPVRPPRWNWRDAVIDFGRACHQDERHALQVERLAATIFAAVALPFNLGPREKRILEAAALLHDVGYLIGHSSHHKHTYHMVRHAELFGFTPREREIIAQVARYHRKSLPKKKHDTFVRLTPRDRMLVMRLGGILRLADGLDRRRVNQVEGVDCILSPSTFTVQLKGNRDFSVELYSGMAKGELFQVAFSRKLLLTPPPSSHCAGQRRPMTRAAAP